MRPGRGVARRGRRVTTVPYVVFAVRCRDEGPPSGGERSPALHLALTALVVPLETTSRTRLPRRLADVLAGRLVGANESAVTSEVHGRVQCEADWQG